MENGITTTDVTRRAQKFKPLGLLIVGIHTLCGVLFMISGGTGLSNISSGRHDYYHPAMLTAASVLASFCLHFVANRVFREIREGVLERLRTAGLAAPPPLGFLWIHRLLFSHAARLQYVSSICRPDSAGKPPERPIFTWLLIHLLCLALVVGGLGMLATLVEAGNYRLYFIFLAIFNIALLGYNTVAFTFFFRVVRDGKFGWFDV